MSGLEKIIDIGTLLVFRFRDWSQEEYMAVVLEVGWDPFFTQYRKVYYIYLSNGDNLFITEDEIIITEII